MIPRPQHRHQHARHGRHARSRGKGVFGAFQTGNSLFKHPRRGVAVAGIDELVLTRLDKARFSGFGIGIDKALGQKNRLGHLAILAAAAALVDKLGAGVPVFGHLRPPARKVRTGKARGLRAAP